MSLPPSGSEASTSQGSSPGELVRDLQDRWRAVLDLCGRLALVHFSRIVSDFEGAGNGIAWLGGVITQLDAAARSLECLLLGVVGPAPFSEAEGPLTSAWQATLLAV